MTMVRGGNERGAAVAVDVLEVGAGGECHLEDFGAALGAGIEERRVLDEILGVDVGALLDEEARDLDAVALGGSQKGRAAALVARVDARAFAKQATHHHQFAALGGRDHLTLLFVALLGRSGHCEHEKQKGGRSRPFNPLRRHGRPYAAAPASASTGLPVTGPESRPFADSSRSTNSITATAALSP
jgi:hypothetical protein